ncbi:MAG: HAMP domain-containing protein [Dehalococcoidales bacterium]|nr:HAMP domain-containing protein [Dehalococcoidales bacterium]
MGKRTGSRSRSRTRSILLMQITVIVIAIFMITMVISLLFVNGSERNLADKSKQKLIESEAKQICLSHEYISNMILKLMGYQDLGSADHAKTQVYQEMLQAISNNEVTQTQVDLSNIQKEMTDMGLLGITVTIMSTPTNLLGETGIYVMLSNIEEYLSKEIPSELIDLAEMNDSENEPYRARVDENNSYMLVEDGISEIGLNGDYLVTCYLFDVSGIVYYFYDFKPMSTQIQAIDDYYRNENRKTIIILAIVLGCSIVVLILITFIVFDYLIKKRITKPIEELEEAAFRVMDGDLDFKVPMNEGEEFSSLKKTFNDMIEIIRDIISKAAGD